MRAAVIGAGVVGSCVGWNLARRGTEVLLIDAGPPGAGVSDWTFAWLNASNKTRTREYFDLNVAGLTAHRDLAAALRPAGWLHLTGNLRWADSPAGAQALRAAADRLAAWGYDVALWPAERVARILEPGVRLPGDETEVAFYRDEGWADGRELAVRLLSESLGHGAEAHFGRPVTGITVTGGRVAEITLDGGQRFPVDAVVNAAGPAGAAIAGLAGRNLPMRDDPGLIARLRCEPAPVRRVLHAPHVTLRPDGPGRVLIHSREIDDLITPGRDIGELTERLRRLAADVAPALHGAELIEARVARRPIPADGFPSVGAASGVAGYYEAVTHSGITLGPVIGELLAAEILDGTVDARIAPFRPDRFPPEAP